MANTEHAEGWESAVVAELERFGAPGDYDAIHRVFGAALLDAGYRIVRADADRGAVDTLRERVMALGGMRRTDQGAFWVDRDDVLRLLNELGGR